MPHGILGGHTATHPQRIAGVSSLLELVSSIINITLQMGRFKTRSARMVQGAGLEPAISKLSVWGLTNLATLT